MNTKWGWGLIGLLLGAGLGFGLATTLAEPEDEDRPPIIVRGGSLIFESGDPGSSEAEERLGKPWMPDGADWQPDHKRGKKVKIFSVAIRGGNPGSCPALAMTKDVSITYTPKDGPETRFRLTLKGRPGSGTPAPAIVGAGLTPAGSAANPQLVFGANGEGAITRVEFQAHGSGGVDCPGAVSIKIVPLF